MLFSVFWCFLVLFSAFLYLRNLIVKKNKKFKTGLITLYIQTYYLFEEKRVEKARGRSLCPKDKSFWYIFSNTHHYFTQMYAIITLMYLTLIKELNINCSWKYFSLYCLILMKSVLPTQNWCYFFWSRWNLLV